MDSFIFTDAAVLQHRKMKCMQMVSLALKKIKLKNLYRLDACEIRSGVNAQIVDSLQVNQQVMILKKKMQS